MDNNKFMEVWDKHKKEIGIAAACICIAGTGIFVAANAEKLKSQFDPSAYADDKNKNDNSVAYDSTVFGTDQSNDNSGMELDEKSENDYKQNDENQNILDNNNSQGLQVSNGNGTGSNNNGNGVAASNDGTGPVISGNGGTGIGTGNGTGAGNGTGNGSGNGGTGDNGGTGGNGTNSYGGTISTVDDPITEGGKANPDAVDIYQYKTFKITLKELPNFYKGQVVSLEDLKQYIDKVEIMLTNSRTSKVASYESVYDLKAIDAFQFKISTGSDTAVVDGTGSFSMLFQKNGLAGTSLTDSISYNYYHYGVTVQKQDGNGNFDVVYTNNSMYSDNQYMNTTLQTLEKDSAYRNKEDGTINQLFIGWYQEGNAENTSSLNTWTLDENTSGEAGDVQLIPAKLQTVPDGYTVKLVSGDTGYQQTLVGYTGKDTTLTVPNGVTAIKMDTEGDVNTKVTTISLPSSVSEIDYDSLMRMYPECEKYELRDDANSSYKVEDGILYATDPSTGERILENVPVGYQGTIYLNSLSENEENLKIGESAFARWTGSDIKIKIGQSLLVDAGWKYIPDGANVDVSSVDGHMEYLRYACMLGEAEKTGVDLTEAEQSLENYYYSDHCMVKVQGTEGQLVYVSSNAGASFASPSTIIIDTGVVDVTSFGTTAFYDATELSYLTISDKVTDLDENVFAGLTSLRSIEVKNPKSLQLPTSGALFGGSYSNTQLKVYLKNVEETSQSYRDWVSSLAKVYGTDDAASHIVCSQGDMVYDSDAAYIKNGTDSSNNDTYTLVSLDESSESYTVPENMKVTKVAENAFYNCKRLKLIVLPADIQQVEKDAFSGCENLEVLSVPAEVKDECSRQVTANLAFPVLKAVVDQSQSQQDSEYVFYNKDYSELLAVVTDYQENSLMLNAKTTMIGDKAVAGCTLINNVYVLSGQILRMGQSAFQNCKSLRIIPQALVRSAGVQYSSIGDQAFENCTNLSVVSIGGNQVALGDKVFAGCTNLASIQYGDSSEDTIVTTGSYTFEGCSNLENVSLVGQVQEIGDGTFKECAKITAISFGEASKTSLERIGKEAFYDCTGVSVGFQMLLYEKLNTVDDYAFYNCNFSNNIVGGACLQKIGVYAFYLDAENADIEQMKEVGFDHNCPITEIGDNAFQNRQSLQTINLTGIANGTEGVAIGNSAFENCQNINRVVWDTDKLASIGDRAFAGCLQFPDANVGVQSNLTHIGDEAFAGCEQLTEADFSGASLHVLQRNTFGTYGTSNHLCENLTTVVLGDEVEQIQAGAFSGASQLISLTLLNTSMVQAGENLFYKGIDGANSRVIDNLSIMVAKSDNNTLRESYVADEAWNAVLTYTSTTGEVSRTEQDFGVIGEGIYYCNGYYSNNGDGTYTLESVNKDSAANGINVRAGTTTIADGAFEGCKNVTTICFAEETTKIGKNVLEGCTGLEAIVFQNKTKVTIDTSLLGTTAPNENLGIYIPTGTADVYGGIPAIKNLNDKITRKTICTGNILQIDMASGAVYAGYESSEDGSTAGYLVQLMYIPRSFNGSYRSISTLNYIYKEAARGGNLTGLYITGYRLIGIGEFALADCKNLKHVDLNSYNNISRLDRIGEGAFQNCVSLYEWAAPEASYEDGMVRIDRVSTMGKEVFKGCTAIKKISWASRNLSDIPEGSFEGCTSLTQFGFVSTLTDDGYPIKSFGKRCFAGCTGFTTTAGSLASFSGLETIGEECYDGCMNMSLLMLPEKLTTMGTNALRGCDSLSVLAISTSIPLSLKDAGIDETLWKNQLCAYVPEGRAAAYRTAWTKEGLGEPKNIVDPGKKYRAISGNIYGCDDPAWTYYGATSGGVYHAGLIFAGTTNTTTVSIYGSTSYRVTGVGAGALANNQVMNTFNGWGIASAVSSGVRYYYYVSYITDIGEEAFKNCKKLTSAWFVPSTTENATYTKLYESINLNIGDSAFEGCSSLTGFTLRKNTKTIGTNAFAGTKEGFVLDATRMTTPSACTLGDKIFGDTLPTGTKIKVKEEYVDAFISAWGTQLKKDYGYNTDEELKAGLFEIVPTATTTTEESISTAADTTDPSDTQNSSDAATTDMNTSEEDTSDKKDSTTDAEADTGSSEESEGTIQEKDVKGNSYDN